MNSRLMINRACRCLLLTLLCSAGQLAAAQNKAAAPPRLQLETCRLPGWSEDVKCGKYEVYEDRAAKAGRKIALRVVVLPALGAKPEPDPVFYFAGGPGGSAVDTIARAGKSYLAKLRQDRDIVAIDQRGTGGSNPLACNLYRDKNDMNDYFGDLFSLDRVRACRAELEKVADLKLYSTPLAMDDVDDVRRALGYDRINLYGGSYGTTAALVYLRQHEQHVRTVTLLGVAPPELQLPLPFAKGVQHALDRVFEDCAADEKCHAAFPNPKADLEAAVKRLDGGPVTFETVNPFTKAPQQVTLTRAGFIEHVRAMLYIPEFTRWLPVLVHRGAKGEFGLFATVSFQAFRLLDDAIARGMHLSVICAEDIPFITDEAATRELAGSFYGDYRLKTIRKACEAWPVAKIPASFTSPIKSDVPVLLISGEADPVTPPWNATAAAKHLANGREVVIRSTGHYFTFPCVDNLTTEFVAKGSAKGLDTSCAAQVRRPPFVTQEMLNAMARNQTAGGSKSGEGKEEVWQGVLDAGAAKYRLILRLNKAANGTFTGRLDSPDQGAVGLPIDTVSWKDQSLRFEMGMISAVYEGKVSGDGSEITGQWQQGGLSLPLTFKRADKIEK